MGKRSNPLAVKSALTYNINEAAFALGKTPATIRNWIKDGLAVMSSRKPYLILGAAIQEYLRAKNKRAKRPLESTELFCPSCRIGRRPLDMVVTNGPISPHTSLLKGLCERCGGVCTRMISTKKTKEFAVIFKIAKEAGSAP